MAETQVISIKREGFFSKAQVDSLITIIHKITVKYHFEVEQIMAKMERVNSDDPALAELEESMNALIQEWHFKIKKLGGNPKGLWLVDF